MNEVQGYTKYPIDGTMIPVIRDILGHWSSIAIDHSYGEEFSEADVFDIHVRYNGLKFVNCTPHALNIFDLSGNEVLVIPASGTLIRVDETYQSLTPIAGIPVQRKTFGAAITLPPEDIGTVYIVSLIALNAAVMRSDMYAPGPAVRNDKGQIIGCVGLSQL